MSRVIALIPIDLNTSRLGFKARLDDELRDLNILQHTVRRVASIRHVEKIVLIHPPGQDPLSLLGSDTIKLPKPVVTHLDVGGLQDAITRRWVSARKWAQPNWRGGLGGATCYDELLPPGPLLDALKAHQGDAAWIVRGDWCLFDPELAERQIDLLLQDIQAMKMIFTQAPPGLSGLAVSRELLEQLTQGAAGFGDVLAYNPKKPQIDPIGRDVNCPIPPPARDTAERFIYDTPRSMELIRVLAKRLGDRLLEADVRDVTDVCQVLLAEDPAWIYRRLPRMVTLELTPRRQATGPITPQHYVTFGRPDMDTDLALRIVDQLGEEDTAGDVTLLIGGLGDALLHPDWERIVKRAHEAGVFSIGIETDLLCDQNQLSSLLDSPIDLIKIRFNADTANTYQKVMGIDSFKQVLTNTEWLFNERLRRIDDPNKARGAMPWLIPSMAKTVDTLPEMEAFFDKWTYFLGHALITPACDGCGLMPAMSPVPMAPPDRKPCLQMTRRISILSDGVVALCDQDWLGRVPMGDTRTQTLIDIWRSSQHHVQAHYEQRWQDLTICGSCVEWHRP
ncbi:MAG: hypothetical protein Kow00105_19080 [Phycisphaeraceae bacterium]